MPFREAGRWHDVPEGSPHVEVALLALVEKPERDQLRGDAARCRPKHGSRWQLDRVHQAHCSHPEDEQRHQNEEEAVEESSQNLCPGVAEGPRRRGFAFREPHRHQGDEYATDSRKGVEGI